MNKKVMAMFEKAEDEYNALISKKNTIEVSYRGQRAFAMYFNSFVCHHNTIFSVFFLE